MAKSMYAPSPARDEIDHMSLSLPNPQTPSFTNFSPDDQDSFAQESPQVDPWTNAPPKEDKSRKVSEKSTVSEEYWLDSRKILVSIAPERGGVVFKHVNYILEQKVGRITSHDRHFNRVRTRLNRLEDDILILCGYKIVWQRNILSEFVYFSSLPGLISRF